MYLSTPNHTLHKFSFNCPPGYKMTVTPHNLTYLQINSEEISTLSIRIVDQNSDFNSHAHSVVDT